MEFGDEDKADITRASLHFSFSLSLRENKLVIWQKKRKEKACKKGGCVPIKGDPGISQEFLQENSTGCYDASKVSITKIICQCQVVILGQGFFCWTACKYLGWLTVTNPCLEVQGVVVCEVNSS